MLKSWNLERSFSFLVFYFRCIIVVGRIAFHVRVAVSRLYALLGTGNQTHSQGLFPGRNEVGWLGTSSRWMITWRGLIGRLGNIDSRERTKKRTDGIAPHKSHHACVVSLLHGTWSWVHVPTTCHLYYHLRDQIFSSLTLLLRLWIEINEKGNKDILNLKPENNTLLR